MGSCMTTKYSKLTDEHEPPFLPEIMDGFLFNRWFIIKVRLITGPSDPNHQYQFQVTHFSNKWRNIHSPSINIENNQSYPFLLNDTQKFIKFAPLHSHTIPFKTKYPDRSLIVIKTKEISFPDNEYGLYLNVRAIYCPKLNKYYLFDGRSNTGNIIISHKSTLSLDAAQNDNDNDNTTDKWIECMTIYDAHWDNNDNVEIVVVEDTKILFFHFNALNGSTKDNGTIYYIDLGNNTVIEHEKKLGAKFDKTDAVAYDDMSEELYFSVGSCDVKMVKLIDLVPMEAKGGTLVNGFIREFENVFGVIVDRCLCEMIALYFNNC